MWPSHTEGGERERRERKKREKEKERVNPTADPMFRRVSEGHL
jgi:hypothetical protein